MKEYVKKMIRAHCPNIKCLRAGMTAIKLRNIRKYTVENTDFDKDNLSQDVKRKIVAKYAVKWPDYTKKLNKLFEEYIRRSGIVDERDDIEDLRVKVLYDCYCYGFTPDEFFVYQLENKSTKEKRDYISNTEKDIYSYTMNDIVDMDIFFDKYHTYQTFRPYYHRDAISVEKRSDFKYFNAFVQSHPVFVRKNVFFSKGDSVELIDSTTCDKTTRQIFEEMIADGKYIVEERVIQSSYMARLSRKSVNTVRCMTFLINHSVEIGPCFFKMGKGDSFVDNAGAGGIVVGVDRETGQLVTDGFDEFCNSYVEHPDTHIAIKGIQLPQWDELITLVKKLAYLTPTVHYISWDLAHTETGWVIIEGNGSGQFIIPQIVWQRGFKRDIERYMQDIDLLA